MDTKNKIRQQNINKKVIREVGDSLEKVKSLGEKLTGMDYFIGRMEDYYANGIKNGSDYVGTTCIQVPDELIYAMGKKPVRLCSGVNTFNQLGGQLLPATICPLVKATAGSIMHLEGHHDKVLDLIINPMTCDQKKKLSETQLKNISEWYNLDFPSKKEDQLSQYYWLMSIEKLIRKLEKKYKKKLKEKNLKSSIVRVARAQKAFRRLHNLRAKGNFINGTFAFIIANTYFFDDIDRWTEQLELLIDEIESSSNEGQSHAPEKKKRILLTGSPSIFPNLNLSIMLEQMEAIVAVDEFCSSNRLLYDMVAVDEWKLYDMIPALADKYLKPSTCPTFVPNDDRIRRILSLHESHNTVGVIYQVFQGCHLYDLESNIVVEALKEKDIPVLVLATDYSPDDSGQMQTRVEAFLDSLN